MKCKVLFHGKETVNELFADFALKVQFLTIKHFTFCTVKKHKP